MTTTEKQIQACSSGNNEAENRARRVSWIRPQYNVNQDAESYTVRVYLPGISREQTAITVDKDTLEIVGRRDVPEQDSTWKVLHREIPEADYRLRLELNAPVDRENISARSENGVLTVTLPVADVARPRQIAIN